MRKLLMHCRIGLLVRGDERRIDRVLDMSLNQRSHRLRKRARNVVRDVRTKQQAFNLIRQRLHTHQPLPTSRKSNAHLLHAIRHTSCNLSVQRILDLSLGNLLQRWQHRVLHLAPNCNFHNSCGILCELVGNELQNGFLARKVCCLVRHAQLVQPLV